ncbi:MAG TPA: glycosyltransferase family 4 protein [Patescibacteria group bacterium]|nr:glycosyltransferase family 4 protein [Patescibacteria group bacterium]
MLAHTNAPWTPHYARHFQSAGHDVRVFSFSPDPLPGVEVVHLSAAELPGPLKPLGFAFTLPRVRRLLDQFHPDVVLATYMSSNGMTAALCWKGPLVVSARGGDVLQQASHLPGGVLFHGPMMRFVSRHATTVHAVSEEIVEKLVAYGVPAARIVCFPMGVDSDSFAPPADAHPSEAPLHIICTRRQEPVYRTDTLVKALHLLRQAGRKFRCTMAGGGPLMRERLEQIRRLDLSDVVTCTDYVPHETIRSLLRTADIYVSASASDGTSSSLLEAMACGLFPVVSRIRANEPWIRDGETGLFFQVGDAAGLGRALERALDDASLRERATLTNRALVQREANQKTNMNRLLELLSAAAGTR